MPAALCLFIVGIELSKKLERVKPERIRIMFILPGANCELSGSAYEKLNAMSILEDFVCKWQGMIRVYACSCIGEIQHDQIRQSLLLSTSVQARNIVLKQPNHNRNLNPNRITAEKCPSNKRKPHSHHTWSVRRRMAMCLQVLRI